MKRRTSDWEIPEKEDPLAAVRGMLWGLVITYGSVLVVAIGVVVYMVAKS